MRKLLTLFSSLLILCANFCFAKAALEPFTKDDRVLILAPHPDDETIGCAGVIQQALFQKAKVRIVYLTNGDHNEAAFVVYEKRLTLRQSEFIHMGEVRRKEAINAAGLLGLSEQSLVFLGYPDYGTFTIFGQYWQTKKPYKNLLTRISKVPYKNDFSYGSGYLAENILDDLKKVLLAYRPNKIFVSHPQDTNPDHRALYLFTQIALRDLAQTIPNPQVYTYLVHCVGWPLPRHFHPELGLDPPKPLADSSIEWQKFYLTKMQLDRKYQATLCHKSQTRSAAFYLFSFIRKNELFGDYPEIGLNRQVSLKAKGINFFGFSNMYADSDTEFFGSLDNLIEHKGTVSYAVVDNHILIRVEKEQRFNQKFGFLLYLFGYKDKTPFAQMPKVRIITRNKKFKVFDGAKRINPQGISLELNSKFLILKVPLSALGDPDFILTSLKAYAGFLPIDTIGFRRIVIK
jgi:LmbE family N-acetylglucosaminyl deacetylase